MGAMTTRLPSPALDGRGGLGLLALGTAAALSSIAALLLEAVHWVRMPFTVTFVSLPGLVLLICMTVWAGRTDRRLLYNRLLVGGAAGAVGLVAYDLIRLAVQDLLPVGFDAFYSLRVFGTLMTGRPIGSDAALAAGWAYHISNGITFGVIYALLAGPARWWWGLAWGSILEIGMIAVYPAVFLPSVTRGFLLVSVVGHAVFGAIVGLLCQQAALPAQRTA